MFMLALIFASNESFGQTYIDYVEGTPACAPAITLTCASTAGPLNPAPGISYNYSITTDPGSVASVLWFVTDVNPVMAAGVLTASRDAGDGTGTYILSAEAGVYNTTGITTTDIDITWQYFDGIANEVLLVAYVTGAPNCNDEIEVWRIKPSFTFTLDVISMNDDGTLGTVATPASECVSPVQDATYNAGLDRLTMDYGENWVFFSVNAANFSDSWMPDLSAVSSAGKTIGAVEWAYPTEAGATGTWHPETDEVEAQISGGVVGSTGECIVVRVEVQNGNNASPRGAAATETITLSVNGIMYDAANINYTNTALADVDEGASACVQNVTDQANFTLTPRPALSTLPATPFVTKN